MTCILADSYLDASARESSAAAEMAAARKISKYAHLSELCSFFPVAVETHGLINASAVDLLNELGRRITALSGDTRDTFFLFQRISHVIQRFNAVLLYDRFSFDDQSD